MGSLGSRAGGFGRMGFAHPGLGRGFAPAQRVGSFGSRAGSFGRMGSAHSGLGRDFKSFRNVPSESVSSPARSGWSHFQSEPSVVRSWARSQVSTDNRVEVNSRRAAPVWVPFRTFAARRSSSISSQPVTRRPVGISPTPLRATGSQSTRMAGFHAMREAAPPRQPTMSAIPRPRRISAVPRPHAISVLSASINGSAWARQTIGLRTADSIPRASFAPRPFFNNEFFGNAFFFPGALFIPSVINNPFFLPPFFTNAFFFHRPFIFSPFFPSAFFVFPQPFFHSAFFFFSRPFFPSPFFVNPFFFPAAFVFPAPFAQAFLVPQFSFSISSLGFSPSPFFFAALRFQTRQSAAP